MDGTPIQKHDRAYSQDIITSDIHFDEVYKKARALCEDKTPTDDERKEAFSSFKYAADRGHLESMCCLSCSYLKGYGCEQNNSHSLYWAMKAANMRNRRAEFVVGWLLYSKLGANPDYPEAVKWFNKAAEQGHSPAQYYLGLCYELGKGVEQDYAEAVRWYTKAAEHGSKSASAALDRMKREGKHHEEVAVDDQKKGAAFLTRIKDRVSNWNTVHGIPHYFFYYYYPVRFTDISYDSEEARRLVYRFKDGEDHERVRELVINKLRSTFSSLDLSQMTFACIPASTISVNKSRYEAFSGEVCRALDMWNGFDHITITREKTPSHLGGTDNAEYSFDRSFFKDKLVILFDDIVTRGGSISSMKTSLEALGARVICAISIGKTFSDWNGHTPQPHPYTGTV